jgi:hypothetical protein
MAALTQLYTWFRENGRWDNGQAFDAMLEFLADSLRIHALNKKAFEGLDPEEPTRLALTWLKTWLQEDDVEDDLGDLLQFEGITNDRLGQILTPMALAQLMLELVQVESKADQEQAPPPGPGGEGADAREPSMDSGPGETPDMVAVEPEVVLPFPGRTLDSSCGTGRLLLRAMTQNAGIDCGMRTYVGDDIDLRMVRASILNLCLGNVWRMMRRHPPAPFVIVWANPLVIDIADPRVLAHANEWSPPHWSSFLPPKPAPGEGKAKTPKKKRKAGTSAAAQAPVAEPQDVAHDAEQDATPTSG